MMFSVQAKAVGPYRQGSVVGLRQTMNRLSAIVIQPLVGGIADHWAGQSFVILGGVLLVLCAPVTLITRRAARTATSQAEPTLSD